MKLVGILLVFIASCGVGIVKSFEYTKAQNELHSLILLMKFIKREVSLYLTKQKEIFMRFENKTLENIGFLNALRSREFDDEKSPLYHVLKEYDGSLLIDAEAMEILLDFAKDFGQMGINELCEKSEITISALEEIYNNGKEEVSSRVKLCRSSGCIAGAIIALLLI
jgi:stage III sporulation protein AB